MKLKVYVDRLSQPSRAIIIFCKMNGIDFEEIRVDLLKGQHRTPEFKEINPMGKVPSIVDGRFNLFESHAILIYLACAFPGVRDHWYPADLFKRAKIHCVLDWHHSNLRSGAAPLVRHSVLAPAFGLPLNPQAAAEAEKLLSSSLHIIETIWLKGNAKFLLGSLQPSIADLSLVCEIMQLEDARGNDVDLSSYKGKVLLVVNVASQCGLTNSNYTELSQLYEKYKDQGLEILAFPCNQFGEQEPGSNEQILEFTCTRFKAEYPIFDKVEVNGENTAPVYKFLKSSKGGLFSDNIKWNFSKFLVDKDGHVVDRYAPTTSPLSIEKDIKKLLGISS